MTLLILRRSFGLLTVQDMGRPGHLAQGLSRGGAMDRQALIEAAALLGAGAPLAAIEMAGAGGIFEFDEPTRVALTGAPMAATLDGAGLCWHASHLIMPGQMLTISGVSEGSYGYLTPAGGIATPEWMGSRAAHLQIGIFAPLEAGAIPIKPDPEPDRPPRLLAPADRFKGREVRVIDGPQTALFDDDVLQAFFAAEFTRSARGNRQGIRFDTDRCFSSGHTAGLASDLIGPGDLQMTGDGVPYVLMSECQTMGGYPRLGTVIPTDLPIIAQAAPGTKVNFKRISLEEADQVLQTEAEQLKNCIARSKAMLRDPSMIPDLLSFQLVGGVTAGDELEDI